jgi:serine/threonine protein phosphatase PrpC
MSNNILVYAWACSDVGRKRSQNQDAYLVAPDLRLFGVADGMGGHFGGEVASDLAVRTIDAHVRRHRASLQSDAHVEPSRDPAALILAEAVRKANEVIHDTGNKNPDLRGMGTTTSGVLFSGGRAFVAHVGDSRIYLVRSDRIVQLTDDHSVVYQQLKAGLITAEQAKASPFRHIIMRSVGVDREVEVDVVAVDVLSGDTFVMCSDGLSNLVSDDEINAIVNEHFLHRVPEVLIDLANERGGSDNITVVVAYAVEANELA